MPKQMIRNNSPREIHLGLWRSYRVMLSAGPCFRSVNMALNYTNWTHCRFQEYYCRHGNWQHPLTIPLVRETSRHIDGLKELLNIKRIARSPKQLCEMMGPDFRVRWRSFLTRKVNYGKDHDASTTEATTTALQSSVV